MSRRIPDILKSNLPLPIGRNQTGSSSSSKGKQLAFTGDPADPRNYRVEDLLMALNDNRTRENAILLLNKIRISGNEKLGLLLWNCPGAIFALLQEIMKIYYVLSTPELTEVAAKKVCDALALIQTVAAHPETKKEFVRANFAEYLYPLLNPKYVEKPFEYLRVNSLGVIGSLLKEAATDGEIIKYLIDGSVIPKCLFSMEVGGPLTKSVGGLIIEKLLNTDLGAKYCVWNAKVVNVMTRVFGQIVDQDLAIITPSNYQLRRYIINCYLRLSEDTRACTSLKTVLPLRFSDPTFWNMLFDDEIARANLERLFSNVFPEHHRAAEVRPSEQHFGYYYSLVPAPPGGSSSMPRRNF
ncbi:hypothetical protein UlMin_022987 [Ulmus minor]